MHSPFRDEVLVECRSGIGTTVLVSIEKSLDSVIRPEWRCRAGGKGVSNRSFK